MNLILLGEPGSGKGTQAEMLVKKLGLYYLQGGELAREWAEKDERIKKIVESGELIPEKEMTEFVRKYLEEKVPEGENILFEGFPRFIPQFEDYEKWLNSKGSKIDAVISLDMSEDAAIKRLSSRRVCENCGEVYNLITNPPPAPDRCKCGGRLVQRKDDNPDSIKVRFQYYRNNTKKLIDYLESQGRLIKVDADRPIQIIFDEILEKLGVDND
ncbi:hypothetical protein A2962_05640 [Candidatus Woesebacteria bacterium RIFCSPLOWO2_01_FULL_39_61]|uniref:Adenylate kinase n=2 Tax=Microgenomates group TaxID=1794810 RepID=A0A0H4T8Z1_9BACT|nr:adenylate kinase, adenylate kinase [uncultured Microgenomates bacterium Rifle_16ft_4_minimus_37836]OGM28070.1 MAG: hypothetical protein A2692_05380 [Candidatus Woesebacteria bacterium RIFCSPHIGHO2_01_FULL_39_95]OGM34058.1 MAG: hypothetical protein A3D01_03950 [Candidatus Woesebacteria bacterium RIFCSPHIGHO2_02_FULL_39_13]OGM38316.1 MAG: hypothetical protein A3E13_06060 [Candidatus Woesebacteria bacterium RIFCSPHIGHO2_12_FULL_40_20]OGM67779.1 MAG: hypothetical protein A2962_05640 [Candidatus 